MKIVCLEDENLCRMQCNRSRASTLQHVCSCSNNASGSLEIKRLSLALHLPTINRQWACVCPMRLACSLRV